VYILCCHLSRLTRQLRAWRVPKTLDFFRQRSSARAGMARLPALVLLVPLLVLAVTLVLLVELADLGGHGVRRPRVRASV